MLLISIRPAYSIPSPIEKLCAKFNIELCAGDEVLEETESNTTQAPVARNFTESEKEILTRLLEKEQKIQAQQTELNRRESHLKSLEEDIQRQILQLEQLQKQVEERINAKKTQDTAQLDKAVALYEKMEGKKAADSISKLNQKIAIQILMKLKDKTASEILSNMRAEDSARLVEEITKK